MLRKPNQRKQYIAHYNRVERYASLLDGIYTQAAGEFTKLALLVNHDPVKAFKWSNYPQTKRKVDDLLRDMSANIYSVVVNGVTAEWNESNFKNDRLARSVIGITQFDKDDKGRDIIPARFEPYFNNNADALHSFIGRKQKGLNLSKKIWKLSEQYKSDLELALSVGLSDGHSAAELSRDIRTYLKEPIKLFRRVRSENGNLQLSKAAKAYHPGAGTYRSSYKNAMRLTRTEINMAYRTADNTRWGQLDFVVGFEVKRSGHGYDCSVCESLAGKYPKDFKFVGWHPHCRCYVIPILKNDDEFWAWDGRGTAPTSSVNEIKEVPQGFNDWVARNSDRITTAQKNGTLPYFLRDNAKYASIKEHTPNKASSLISAQQRASVRHSTRTTEQISDIQNRWDERKAIGAVGADKLYSKIIDSENEIRKNAKFETAILYNRQGEILVDKRGKATSVSFTAQEGKLMKDGILTHNHPRGWAFPANSLGRIGNSFSPADLITAVRNDLSEIRAVTPTYIFTMKRPATGWGVSVETVKREINKMERDIIDDIKKYVVNTKSKESLNRANAITYHKLAKEISTKYGWQYSKSKTI